MTAAVEKLDAASARPPERLEAHRALLDIARRQMTKPAWGTAGMVAAAFAAFSASCFAALTNIWPYWAAMILNAYIFLMLFMGVHEALHQSICGENRRLRWLNDLIGWLCGMVTLIPYRGYDIMHMVHHRYTNDPARDPDYWCSGRTVPMLFVRFFTLTPHYVYMMMRLGFHRDPDHKWRYWVSVTHHAVAWGSLIVGIRGGWAYEQFMLWIGPTILNVALIAFSFNWLPHRPHLSQERYLDSSVFLLPKPVHWIVTRLDMFQNYHLIHHLFPRIPFYRLGRAFIAMRPMLEAEGAPIFDFQKLH